MKRLITFAIFAWILMGIVPERSLAAVRQTEAAIPLPKQNANSALLAAKPAPAKTVELDGRTLALWWVLPFVGMLLSIALMPLIAPHFWHHHYGKVTSFWIVCFLTPYAMRDGPIQAVEAVLHVLLLEYFPFVILLLSLFTIAGGVRLTGNLVGTPLVNSVLLLIGTFVAGWMGTTAASMLLIRPMIRANQWRKKQVHLIVFFIFLVANIGGALSPLGDPPLFLGFLKGIDFFWPTVHLALPLLFVSGILLVVFFVWDSLMFRAEYKPTDRHVANEKFGLDGKVNLLLLAGVVLLVFISGIWKPLLHVPIMAGVSVELQNLVRDLGLLSLTALSLKLTPIESRGAQGFSWFPMIEVAKLFAGIFITMIPALAILRAGPEGAMAGLVQSITKDGHPNNAMYFWLTGTLSSFLDNAPTFLIFFNAAGGDPTLLMQQTTTLLAISAGAVFFGANTYIGNAPNFMVRSIAQEQGIRMPSFFGYMGYSICILIPVFVLMTWIWF